MLWDFIYWVLVSISIVLIIVFFTLYFKRHFKKVVIEYPHNESPKYRMLFISGVPSLVDPKKASKLVDIALSDENEYVRRECVKHNYLNSEQIDVAIHDSFVTVRRVCVQRNELTPEQVDVVLVDEDWSVRWYCVENQTLTEEQVTRTLEDDHDRIVRSCIEYQELTRQQYIRFANHQDYKLRTAAINNIKDKNLLMFLSINGNMKAMDRLEELA